MNTHGETSESMQMAEALQEQREWLRVALSSIGDAVITTDTKGCVTFLNPVAQSLTGWTEEGAAGVSLTTVFKIVNEETRQEVENPATRTLRDGVVVGLANHTLLVAQDGTERPIDDSAAPIRNANGELAGVVLVFRDVTERRQGERLILDTLNYCECIIATLREPFIVLDSDLRVKSANRCFYETFHVSPEETENQFIYDLGDGQWDIPELRRLSEAVLSDGHSIHDFEVERTFPVIGRKALLLNVHRFISMGSPPTLMLLAIEDITKRKQAEADLEVSELRYRRLFEAAKDGILILDVNNGKITEANPFICELLGHPLDYLLGKELWEIGLFKDIEAGRTAFREVKEHGYLRSDNIASQTNDARDGRQIKVELVSNVYREDDHDVIQCNVRDITERRQLEEATEDSELRYRRLFETAQDAIFILDANTKRILDANPYIQNLLGYTKVEFVGKELWELGLFRDAEESKAAYRKLQDEGSIRYDHLPLEAKDGREVEVEFVSNVYQVGNMTVIQCNIRDITERRRLEQQTNEQAEALAELHRRKDEFLAMLSHELRNPLSAIFNALHILRLQAGENPLQHKARIVLERQVGQLGHLVDDLLEVSRVITGRIQLHQERLDLRGIVERAIESTRPLIDRHRHELSVSMPAEPIWLQGDPTRLEQVVVNLLNNAAKYTEEGGQIWLTARQEGDEVSLRIQDTGIGIPLELQPRIFDLFTQASRTLGRSQGGLGIGLSLVHKLVHMHGGTVEVQSAGLGHGSEFIVRLPALAPAVETVTPVEIIERLAPTSRVLVVDDNKDAADMLVMLLKMFGHDVRVAYSGQAALEAAVEYQPDFILLDIGLPDTDGYKVAERLRQLPETKDVMLIALTGYGQDSDRRRSLEAGFDHHLVKPVDPQKLQVLIASMAAQA